MNKNLNFWAKVAFFFMVYTWVMGLIQESDMAAAKVEAYANGMAQGIKFESRINQEQQADKAAQWWAGSQNMEVARDRLCKNYYRKGK